jgi:hypothetical protein
MVALTLLLRAWWVGKENPASGKTSRFSQFLKHTIGDRMADEWDQENKLGKKCGSSSQFPTNLTAAGVADTIAADLRGTSLFVTRRI